MPIGAPQNDSRWGRLPCRHVERRQNPESLLNVGFVLSYGIVQSGLWIGPSLHAIMAGEAQGAQRTAEPPGLVIAGHQGMESVKELRSPSPTVARRREHRSRFDKPGDEEERGCSIASLAPEGPGATSDVGTMHYAPKWIVWVRMKKSYIAVVGPEV